MAAKFASQRMGHYNSEPTWSPDGKWIAHHCTQEGDTQICVISPEGQPAGEPIPGTAPVWSPGNPEDGARLAFLCFQESHSDICMMQADGSELVNLTNSTSDEHSTAWSPDGNWLAFVSNRGNDVDVYKVCATCPEEPVAVRLTDEPRSTGWPVWSPDGSRVAYVAGEDLMLVNADRSGVTYLASGVFGPPIWQPNPSSETWQTYTSQDGSDTVRFQPETEIRFAAIEAIDTIRSLWTYPCCHSSSSRRQRCSTRPTWI
jgi:Tol biopolymer transport system component